jgi:hypothetical protein
MELNPLLNLYISVNYRCRSSPVVNQTIKSLARGKKESFDQPVSHGAQERSLQHVAWVFVTRKNHWEVKIGSSSYFSAAFSPMPLGFWFALLAI